VNRDFEVTKTLDNKNVEIAICDMVIQSQPLNQALIRTVDPMPLRGIGDRDLEGRDATSPDPRNANS
jgi:hypothetical protein